MFIPVLWRTVLASVIVAETVSRFQRSNGHDPDYSAGPPVRLHYTHGHYQTERMDSKTFSMGSSSACNRDLCALAICRNSEYSEIVVGCLLDKEHGAGDSCSQ